MTEFSSPSCSEIAVEPAEPVVATDWASRIVDDIGQQIDEEEEAVVRTQAVQRGKLGRLARNKLRAVSAFQT